MKNLPDDILRVILLMLTPQEALLLARVSKQFRDVVMSDQFWDKKLQQYYPFQYLEDKDMRTDRCYLFFRRNYSASNLTHEQQLKFSYVKENRHQELTAIGLTSEDLLLQEANTKGDMLSYAQFHHSRVLLDFFFASFAYADPNQQLIWALRCHQSVAIIEEHIKRGADVNYATNTGFRPIDCIAISGDVSVFQLLVEKGASLATQNRQRSLLHLAAIYDNFELIVALARAGVDLHARDSFQYTPLMCAIRLNRRRAVEKLLSLGAHVEPITFSFAMSGNPELLPLLLRFMKLDDRLLYTFLREAVSLGQMMTVELLITNGADKNRALVLAASRSLKLVKQLVLMGADISVVDDGATILHRAAESHNQDIARYVGESGSVNINATDKKGNTAMHIAVITEDVGMFFLLHRLGAQTDSSNLEGKTVQQIAEAKNLIAVVDTLSPGYYKQKSKAISITRPDGTLIFPVKPKVSSKKL